MIVRSFGISDVGLKRNHNEDNFFRSDDLGLFLVADGMGGHAAGEVASHAAITAIVEFTEKHASDDSVTWPFGFEMGLTAKANAMLSGIRLANQQLFMLQQDRPELNGMGTTIAALRMDIDSVTLAHVGDSRVYRFRDGSLDLLTSDHSWVNEQLQKHIITADEARNHRYKNVITRALGNRLDLEIDTSVEQLRDNDMYLLCSDGLSGMVEDPAIADTMQRNEDLRTCANKLVALANEAGGQDNVTVVLVRFGG